MAEIKLARVDGRMIHGATMIWAVPLGADILVAVDDATAADEFSVKILKSSAKGIRTEVFSVKKLVELWTNGRFRNLKILLIFKSVEMAYNAVKAGLPLDALQLGYIIPSKESTISTSEKSIVLTPKEVEQLKDLQSDNVNVYLQYTKQSPVVSFNANELKY